jgi:carbon-monoxide dehydrogenase small subunit
MTLLELQRTLDGATVSEDDIRHALAAHLCRCTGYQGIVDAALDVLNGDRRQP